MRELNVQVTVGTDGEVVPSAQQIVDSDLQTDPNCKELEVKHSKTDTVP